MVLLGPRQQAGGPGDPSGLRLNAEAFRGLPAFGDLPHALIGHFDVPPETFGVEQSMAKPILLQLAPQGENVGTAAFCLAVQIDGDVHFKIVQKLRNGETVLLLNVLKTIERLGKAR
jgi:hypothetical protein